MSMNGISPDHYSDAQRLPGIDPPRPPTPPPTGGHPGISAGQPRFSDTFMSAVQRLNDMEVEADTRTRALATGESDDVLGAALSSEKANLAMNTALRIRSDVLDAYEQIMRMPL